MDRFETIILWNDEDQAFVADAPEMASCTAHGDSHESALAVVEDAIALWLDAAQATGRVLPSVRGTRLPLG